MIKRIIGITLFVVILTLVIGLRQITHYWPVNELDKSLRSADEATNRNIRRVVEVALNRDELFGPLSLWVGEIDYALLISPCNGSKVDRRYELLFDRRYSVFQSISQCTHDLDMSLPSFDPQTPVSNIRQVLKTSDLRFAKQAVGWCYQLANNPALGADVMQQTEGIHCYFSIRYEHLMAHFALVYPQKTFFALADDIVVQFIKERWDVQLHELDQQYR